MKIYNILSLILLCSLVSINGYAQQSSKSKSSKTVYEKGGAVELINTKQINTTELEFSPTYYQNGIVYATSRYKNGERDKKINETYFELFYAEMDANGLPANPKSFSIEVNSALHEGPVTFNRAFDVMYFTRNNMKKGLRKADAKGVTRLKIYEAQKGKTDWDNVKELPFNSAEFSSAHPTLSADGRKLYFASDRPGGMGGMDIYVVEKNGAQWSTPKNLGPKINTDKNEAFPFIHSSGNLFFSSNGLAGAGGLDIFIADLKEEDNITVYNLGEPFNSSEDDLGLILDPTGTTGYFTSARSGGAGKDDIYRFTAENGIFGNTKANMIDATLVVFDKKSQERLRNATVRVFEKTQDGFIGGGNSLYEAVLLPVTEGSSELVFKLIRKDAGALGDPDRITNVEGEANYPFLGERQYLIVVEKEGYKNNEMAYSTIGNQGEILISIPLEKTSCNTLAGVVKNSRDGAIVPNAVVRIVNECDGTEEAIVTNNQGSFSYCMAPGCGYRLTGVKERYASITTSITADNNLNDLTKEVLLKPMSNENTLGPNTINAGTMIVLEKIYYDFNKSYIRTGAARELDELLAMMQRYPSMEIELRSHTDSRGGTRYNRKLSQRRADAAKQYLLSRGISANRVQAVGFGETELRNRCTDGVDCTEEEHQYNRRTEVYVTKINNQIQVEYEDNAPKIIDKKD